MMFRTVFDQAQRIADAAPGAAVPAPPPTFMFGMFAVVWGGGMLIWVLNLVLGIVYGIKAHDGKWDGYPVVKKWAAKAAGV
jgi:hypothetical protein